MRVEGTLFNSFFWLGMISLVFSATSADGQTSDRLTDAPQFYTPSAEGPSTTRLTDDPAFFTPVQEPVDVPVLMDPRQFRVSVPEVDPQTAVTLIGDTEPEKENSTADAVKRRTEKAKKKIARTPDKEENRMLDALPNANLSVGLRPNPMQRSTYNRVNLLDYNRSFQAAYPAPVQRKPDTETTIKTWRSPDMVHNPLYFEEANLERYGNTRGVLQPFYSGVHFFSSVAVLPYKKGARPPRDCEFSLGHYRPGDCNPGYRPTVERSGKGLLRQGLMVGAALGL